jgi:hypothetical protein
MYTHLRVPYDACVKHISRNLRRNLKIQVVKPELPDVVQVMPIDSISSLNITQMEEKACDTGECLSGIISYNNQEYRFRTHQWSYDVVLIMEKTNYPFHCIKLVLPITSWCSHREDKICIPAAYTTDKQIIPVEFVWEFLSQLPVYLHDTNTHTDALQ